MPILRCRTRVNELGNLQFFPFAIEEEKQSRLVGGDDVPVFTIMKSGAKIDMRHTGPFFPIIPCTYCGTDNDRKHDPLRHVNPALGTTNLKAKFVDGLWLENPLGGANTAPTQDPAPNNPENTGK